jgi:hypothetical protein
MLIESLHNIPIPMVESDRSLPGCQSKLAILFCDNCTPNCSDVVKRELGERGILLMAFPPDTSDIFQFLDRHFFESLEAAKNAFCETCASEAGSTT